MDKSTDQTQHEYLFDCTFCPACGEFHVIPMTDEQFLSEHPAGEGVAWYYCSDCHNVFRCEDLYSGFM